MQEMKINWTAFLIKKEYVEFDDIIDKEVVYKLKLKNKYNLDGYLYIGENDENKPKWYEGIKTGVVNPPDLYNKSTRAVLVVRVNNRLIAFSFGRGRYMIYNKAYVRNFGLKVVLNNCVASKLKSIDTLKLDYITSLSQVQTSTATEISNFDIDNSRELLKGIEAESNDYNRYSKIISGKDSFHFKSVASFDRIKELANCLIQDYNSEKYKKDFEWIDHLSEVTDPNIKEILNKQLVDRLNENIKQPSCLNEHLSPKEILNLDSPVQFSYTEKGKQFDEIQFSDYIRIKKRKELSIEILKRDSIFVHDIDNNELIRKWSLYDTMNSELVYEDTFYILALGDWYEADHDYVEEINFRSTV